MYNMSDLDYLTEKILIKGDAIEDIDALRCRVEYLKEMLYQTREDLRRTQIDRVLIEETNGSRLYIEGHNIDKLPADLEDVTLRELLEIISI